MNVKQLIAVLSKLPIDSEVILQKDGEGNGYSPLADVWGDNCAYLPDSTYSGSGQVGLAVLRQEDVDAGFGIEDCVGSHPNAVRAVCLQPVN